VRGLDLLGSKVVRVGAKELAAVVGDLVPRTGVLRVAFGTRLAGERAVAMRPVALVSLAQDLGDLDALQDALAAKDRAEGSHERVEPMCVNRRRRFPC